MKKFEWESEIERKKQKFYLVSFALAASIHIFISFFGLGTEKSSEFHVISSFLFYAIVFYLGLQKKFWAEFIIKFFVWLNVFLLFVIAAVKILELLL
ncbi:hypothetical protein [Planomicrobium sp. CPCC 101110]|uniref:hypothetical protein n=1 Tax=Planomicrobium sp. CPCC 101110 TaxID=2599619 RepID=UPI0011B4D041|nr:hypothetical protein [Planomicrobium sp. CPCC 101110]TWT27247.1 hypothetical protein FQV30_01635 [Planomicrobium sp. CPCC 101110]